MNKLFILCLLLPLSVWCQVTNDEDLLQLLIEDFAGNMEEDNNYDQLYESMYQLYLHPIDVNRIQKEDLSSLLILTDKEVNMIWEYIINNQPVLSIYEFQSIPGIDLGKLKKLSGFLQVSTNINNNGNLIQRMLREENNFLLLRYRRKLELSEGYNSKDNEKRFEGSPDQLYLRFKVSRPKDFSLGITIEKDAGERFLWKPSKSNYLADFYSYHFMIEEKGLFRKFLVGDYVLQFGQGLILGGGLNFGKGAEPVLTAKKVQLGIRPYTSSTESGFFRGIANTISVNRFDITSFLSTQKKDGNLKIDSSLNSKPFISSVQSTGLHRNNSEKLKRHNFKEISFGGNITYRDNHNNLKLGISTIFTKFTYPIIKRNLPYNLYEFYGKQNYTIGFSAEYLFRNINFFSETAISASRGIGFITGFISSLSKSTEIAFSLRNFQPNFHSFYSSGFGENSRNINEQGIYLGLKIHPLSRVTVVAYFDRFRFPWLKFRVNSPSSGFEYMVRADYSLRRKSRIYLQYKHETKETNQNTAGGNFDFLARQNTRKLIFNLEHSPVKNIKFKTRIQNSWFSKENEITKGFLMAQDINFKYQKISVGGRIAIFDTDDFINRQYIYEKNVLYSFSIPFYQGRGTRIYLIGNYKLNRNITLWLRWGRTTLRNTNQTGSGLNTIEGNTITEITGQIRYKF